MRDVNGVRWSAGEDVTRDVDGVRWSAGEDGVRDVDGVRWSERCWWSKMEWEMLME